MKRKRRKPTRRAPRKYSTKEAPKIPHAVTLEQRIAELEAAKILEGKERTTRTVEKDLYDSYGVIKKGEKIVCYRPR